MPSPTPCSERWTATPPVTTVAAEARLARWSQRFTPRLRRAIARIDLTPPSTTPPSTTPLDPLPKEPAP